VGKKPLQSQKGGSHGLTLRRAKPQGRKKKKTIFLKIIIIIFPGLR
jgi:hypothetical protein